MDSMSVISLGQLSNVPLIGPSSELSYRFEPHDQFPSSDVAGVDVLGVAWGRVYPGLVQPGGTREGYTGY